MAGRPTLPLPGRAVAGEDRVQSLWAGYGSVSRIRLDTKGRGSNEPATLIRKKIKPGKGSGIGHMRKVRSYAVEAAFYRLHAQKVNQAGARVPKPYQIVTKDGESEFILEDLSLPFPKEAYDLSPNECKVVLSWMAAFHSHFWGAAAVAASSSEDSKGKDNALWEQGGYWYLDTRRHEIEGRSDFDEELESIVENAELIDAAMKKASAEFPTIIHGDPKAANIVFSKDGKSCAFYDFQYCGRACGARDLAYLFVSSCGDRCFEKEEELLRFYHQELMKRLGNVGSKYTFEVLKDHFELAIIDFLRFLAGWSLWGSVSWAIQRTEKRLADILQTKKR